MAYFVSVIIPVHNGERFLAEAISSILDQNYAPLEMIVVDDGSTDGTASVVAETAAHRRESVRYVYQPQRGPAAARNRGIELARGEVIAFLDHDDLWAPYCLRTQIEYLAAHPEIEIVQGLIVQMQAVPVDSNANEIRFEPSSEPYHFINLGSAIYVKSVFDRVGSLDERLWEAEDTDWFLRAWEKNIPKVVLDRIVLYYRRHDANLTQEQGQRLLPRLYKMHLDRLRAASDDAHTADLNTAHANAAEYLGLPPRRTAAPVSAVRR